MAVMDEFREEREKMKNASPKEKFAYFWYYYKWHVIITAAVIILLVSFIHDIATKKETVFNAVIINHYTQTDLSENYRGDFEEFLGIDTAKEDTSFDSTLSIDFSSYSRDTINSSEKLMAQAAASSLDILAADETVFAQYAANSFFLDLRELLDAETLAAFEPYLYYAETENGTIAAGVYLNDCTRFLETYHPKEQVPSVLGVFSNHPHKEYTLTFFEYLLADLQNE